MLILLNNKDSFITSEVKYGPLEYESFILVKMRVRIENWHQRDKKKKQEEEGTLG